MCSDCAYRPELVHCSQCRAPLYGQDGTERLTRNRALEELARRTFPPVEQEAAVGRGRSQRNRGERGGRGRERARTARARSGRLSARNRRDDQGKHLNTLMLSRFQCNVCFC